MSQKLIMVLVALIGIRSYSQEIVSTEKLPEIVIKGTGQINMLLVPCMGCRWNAWEEFMERNQQLYKMYAVTLPGYGGTQGPQLPQNTTGTPYRDYVLMGLSEFIDQYKLKDIVVVGHSWGTMVATQLALNRKDVITRLIALDGSIESASWTPNTFSEKLKQADQVIEDYGTKLMNAEEWSKFNGASVGSVSNRNDSVTEETMLTRIKLLTSFMATDRSAMLQYWRENLFVDLTSYIKKIEIPVLDIQAFSGAHQKTQKQQYIDSQKMAGVPSHVKMVFMFDTRHFIMYHRPLELDCRIHDFISGRSVSDFASTESEYFEEALAN